MTKARKNEYAYDKVVQLKEVYTCKNSYLAHDIKLFSQSLSGTVDA